ncbi:MAG: hypothetical protein R3336_05655, partial [Phycisphaeraceae bacterium]|nr:hypothetical protein [Phycisphaeraceae bacterium]
DEGRGDIKLLAGIEVDILKSGKLDLEEATLADLDWVVASIHYDYQMSESKFTDRLLAAIESGVVHCLGHPTARMIGKRDPIPFDRETVFAACAEHDVCLEINSHPSRLDLPDTLCQQARDHGVTFTISTDAHGEDELDLLRFGVAVARRGWVTADEVLNTRSTRSLTNKLRSWKGD